MTKKSASDKCMEAKIAKVMRENKDKPQRQRIAMALNIARKHCGVRAPPGLHKRKP